MNDLTRIPYYQHRFVPIATVLVAVLIATAASASAEPPTTQEVETQRADSRFAEAERLNQEGIALVGQGKNAEALPKLKEALALRRQLFTDDHAALATSLGNLAAVLQLLERSAEAEPLFVQALEMNKRLHTGDHGSVASNLYNLAWVLHLLGRASEAEPLCMQALEMNRRLYKNDGPFVAASLNNLAVICESLGRPAQAEPLLMQALQIQRRLYLGDHAYVATNLNNLAAVRRALGRVAEAEAIYLQALEMSRQLYNENHPAVAGILNNLAAVRVELGRAAEAEPLNVQALQIYRRFYKGDHASVATCLNNLASTLCYLGRTAEATSLFEQALTMQRRLRVGDQTEVAGILKNLAKARQWLGSLAKAEPLFIESLEIRRRLFKGDHPAVAASLSQLAMYCRAASRSKEAEVFAVQSLTMRQRLFKGDHADLAESLVNLAVARESLDRVAEAEPLYREAFDMIERMRAQAIGGAEQRAAFAEALNLDWTAVAYARVLVQLYKGPAALAVLERGRGRAALDWLERGGRDLVAEAEALGDPQRTAELKQAQAREQAAKEKQFETEALLTGLNKQRESMQQRDDLPAPERDKRLADLDQQITDQTEKVKTARQAFTEAGSSVLIALRGLFPAAKAATTEEILAALSPEEAVVSFAFSTDAALVAVAVKPLSSNEPRASARAAADPRAEANPRATPTSTHPSTSAGYSTAAIIANDKKETAALVERINRLRDAIISGSRDESPPPGSPLDPKELAALRDTLLPESIRATLHLDRRDAGPTTNTGPTRLVILPDGPLSGIPFELLFSCDPQGSASANRLDLSAVQICYAPSATVYIRLKAHLAPGDSPGAVSLPNAPPENRNSEFGNRQSTMAQALILGDPDFGSGAPAKEPDYPTQGVLLSSVQPQSNAALASLRRGDVLLSYDGRSLKEPADLTAAIASAARHLAPGDSPGANSPSSAPSRIQESEIENEQSELPLTYWRKGKVRKTTVFPGKLGVQIALGRPDEGLRSMKALDQITRGGDAFSAQCSAVEQIRLFGGTLPALPGTRREATAIAALFGGNKANDASSTRDPLHPTPNPLHPPATLLLGRDANLPNLWKAVTSSPPRCLHLATHGLMGTSERPLDASIALAQPKSPTPDDVGFLRLEDLMSRWGGRLKNCDLVVLSACDTQRGVQKGDTAMSLPLGFFFAGARSVVAGLWKVDDTATQLLMTRFYQNWLGRYDESRRVDGRAFEAGYAMPKLAALREAKAWLRSLSWSDAQRVSGMTPNEFQRYRDSRGAALVTAPRESNTTAAPRPADQPPFAAPRYWAAFVLIGHPGD